MDSGSGLLPGGLVDEQGVVHRQVEMASLSGREELLLTDRQRWGRQAQITALLSRCVRQIGAVSPVTPEIVRELLVADRAYLLLKLRQATFGEQVQATIVCPNQSCGNKMDIDFSISDIPIKESGDKGPLYEVQLSPEARLTDDDGQQHADVVFRLPNGADQEAVAPWLEEDEQRAAVALLARCIQRIGPWEAPGVAGIARLSPQALMEIEQHMEQVAPSVELTMSGDCPECGVPFALPFDLAGFFWSEMQINRTRLLREVHYLAFHYHWSEREIMEMPRALRQQYIEILGEEIKRLNGDI